MRGAEPGDDSFHGDRAEMARMHEVVDDRGSRAENYGDDPPLLELEDVSR